MILKVMLRPLILTFLNVYFEDLLVCNVLLQVVFFLLCYYWAQSSWWQFWVQALVGAALAFCCRLAQEYVLRRHTPSETPMERKMKQPKRQESAAALLVAHTYREEHVPKPTRLGPRLWPRHRDDAWLWGVLCVLATASTTLLYNVRVHGGGTDSLQTPFSVGVLLTVLLMWLVLLVLEGVAYTLQMGQADFKLWGLYPGCGLVVACVAALDMLAFLQGYYLVLILAGLLAGCWAVGWVVWRAMTPEHYRSLN